MCELLRCLLEGVVAVHRADLAQHLFAVVVVLESACRLLPLALILVAALNTVMQLVIAIVCGTNALLATPACPHAAAVAVPSVPPLTPLTVMATVCQDVHRVHLFHDSTLVKHGCLRLDQQLVASAHDVTVTAWVCCARAPLKPCACNHIVCERESYLCRC
jgi:hypothetical protein